MKNPKNLFEALKIEAGNPKFLKSFSLQCDISTQRLKYYNEKHIFPTGTDLEKICEASGLSTIELMLLTGSTDQHLKTLLSQHAQEISSLLNKSTSPKKKKVKKPKEIFSTKQGTLYQGDCLDLMKEMPEESVDLIFADPPFNLNKLYPSGIDDQLKEKQYLNWCEDWLSHCTRLLKLGGSLLVWNLPKWNSHFTAFLNERLQFRHWIAVSIKYRLPISGRLYPSHYSLLYYCKGEKPNSFHPDRLPMEICKSCYADLKDYGGYKDKMNPKGINLTDVWYDIPPVRHSKNKKREGANELSIQLLDRIIEMASDEDDLIFDPFGGSGTTYAVAEIKNRRWIGIEIGPVEDIQSRFKDLPREKGRLIGLRSGVNHLFSSEVLRKRERKNLWTPDSVRQPKKEKPLEQDYYSGQLVFEESPTYGKK